MPNMMQSSPEAQKASEDAYAALVAEEDAEKAYKMVKQRFSDEEVLRIDLRPILKKDPGKKQTLLAQRDPKPDEIVES